MEHGLFAFHRPWKHDRPSLVGNYRCVQYDGDAASFPRGSKQNESCARRRRCNAIFVLLFSLFFLPRNFPPLSFPSTRDRESALPKGYHDEIMRARKGPFRVYGRAMSVIRARTLTT